MRDASVMNVIKDRLYEVIKADNPDIKVRYTYGYRTKYVRIANGLPKSHVIDAMVISGNPMAKPSQEVWELTQVRRHNRQIHKANKLKGGKLKRQQSAYNVMGFRLWDIVKYKGVLYTIKGKRTSGRFSLQRLSDGEKVDGVSAKKLKLVEINNRLRKGLSPIPPRN